MSEGWREERKSNSRPQGFRRKKNLGKTIEESTVEDIKSGRKQKEKSASIKAPLPVVALNGSHSYQGSLVPDGSKQQQTSGLCLALQLLCGADNKLLWFIKLLYSCRQQKFMWLVEESPAQLRYHIIVWLHLMNLLLRSVKFLKT